MRRDAQLNLVVVLHAKSQEVSNFCELGPGRSVKQKMQVLVV
jgi:hypothetical protein